MFGYTQEEFLQQEVANLHPNEALSEIVTAFEDLSQGSRPLAATIPCLRKDGTLFYADIRSIRINFNDAECMLVFFTDTSERMEAENKIRYQANFLKVIIDSI